MGNQRAPRTAATRTIRIQQLVNILRDTPGYTRSEWQTEAKLSRAQSYTDWVTPSPPCPPGSRARTRGVIFLYPALVLVREKGALSRTGRHGEAGFFLTSLHPSVGAQGPSW